MYRSSTPSLHAAFAVCFLLGACTDSRRTPAPPPEPAATVDASTASPREPQTEDAGGTVVPTPPPDAGTARCSASSLSPTPTPPQPPLPPAVESMRRRIVAAAVACDYEALAVLADENGKGLRFSFGPDTDVAAFWRKAETEHGEPVLARLVRILDLPYIQETQQGNFYIWPSVFREGATAKDWDALKGIYPDAQLEAMRKQGSYLGLRIAITPAGDWQLAVAGD